MRSFVLHRTRLKGRVLGKRPRRCVSGGRGEKLDMGVDRV